MLESALGWMLDSMLGSTCEFSLEFCLIRSFKMILLVKSCLGISNRSVILLVKNWPGNKELWRSVGAMWIAEELVPEAVAIKQKRA